MTWKFLIFSSSLRELIQIGKESILQLTSLSRLNLDSNISALMLILLRISRSSWLIIWTSPKTTTISTSTLSSLKSCTMRSVRCIYIISPTKKKEKPDSKLSNLEKSFKLRKLMIILISKSLILLIIIRINLRLRVIKKTSEIASSATQSFLWSRKTSWLAWETRTNSLSSNTTWDISLWRKISCKMRRQVKSRNWLTNGPSNITST